LRNCRSGSNGEVGPPVLHRHIASVDDQDASRFGPDPPQHWWPALQRDLAGEPRHGPTDRRSGSTQRRCTGLLNRPGDVLANALDAVHPGQDADLLKGADRLVHRTPGAAGGLGDRLLPRGSRGPRPAAIIGTLAVHALGRVCVHHPLGGRGNVWQHCASEALGLFMSDTVACLDTRGDSATQRRSRPLLRRHSSSWK
jgi:hypothetical protein